MTGRRQNWMIFSAIVAAAAILTMIALGMWQLQRKGEKEALLARYANASGRAAVAYPLVPVANALPLFRRSRVQCIKVIGWRSISGTSATGEAGFAHLASCQTGGAEGPGAVVAIGWSQRPDIPHWPGGLVTGIIAPHKPQLIKLVATEPIAGLETLARPSPASIPNNHLLYAIQWFIFAAAATVIFIMAMRQKNQE